MIVSFQGHQLCSQNPQYRIDSSRGFPYPVITALTYFADSPTIKKPKPKYLSTVDIQPGLPTLVFNESASHMNEANRALKMHVTDCDSACLWYQIEWYIQCMRRLIQHCLAWENLI